MSAIVIPGLVKVVNKIQLYKNQHYMVYRHQLPPDFVLRVYCGLWNTLGDFGAIELLDMEINSGADFGVIEDDFFVGAAGRGMINIHRYTGFDHAKTYTFGTGHNQNIKMCRTPAGSLACVSYRQRLTLQDKGVYIDLACLTPSTDKFWTGSVTLAEGDFTMPGAEHILVGPDGLLWMFYIKDGGSAVFLVRFKEDNGELIMVDHTAVLTQRDGDMSPNAEFPALSLRLNGDHVLIGCPGDQGVSTGVIYVKPFVARIYPDLTKQLVKHFEVGVPRHWPPIPIYPNRNGVDALLFPTNAQLEAPQRFEIRTENDQLLGNAEAKPNTIAWSEDGFFLYQLPDFSAFKLEQLPLRSELAIERDNGQCKISWTPDYPYALQETKSLSAPRWATVSTTNPTIVSATGDQRFYRLSSNDPVPQLLRPPIPEPRQKRAKKIKDKCTETD